ncbi:outer membrane protein assembly factor BamD [Thermocrinis sp.]|uniref:outer membrane protein assembly factor BamD n=1 Tax=Thermocrinis sp. TaxID=2024383 RepID=UPI002FDCB5C4
MKDKWLTFFLGLLLVFSCAKVTEEKRAQLAVESYTEGMRAFANRDYKKATEKLKESLKYIENLTPSQIKEIKMVLGESYYLSKNYINAIVYLEDFLFSYPEARESEKVYYLLIDSYMKVAPDAYRDQSYTYIAIEKAKDFLNKYPESPYKDKVLEIIEKAEKKLADHEYLIGKFYEDYGFYYSASLRYRDLLINYPEQISQADVLYRYIKSLLLVERQAEKRKKAYKSWLEEAKKSLKEAKTDEDKKAVEKRIAFLEEQINRWNGLAKSSKEEGIRLMQRYKELYGENNYYRELEKLTKR